MTDREFLDALSSPRNKSRTLWKQAIHDGMVDLALLFCGSVPRRADSPRYLHLGCGGQYLDGWINADLPDLFQIRRGRHARPDWFMDSGRPWKCPDSYFDGILTEHMLEHMVYRDGIFALRESFRTLRPGACIRISLPSFERYLEHYQGEAIAEEFGQFVHPVQAISDLTQLWGHRSVWTGELLCRVLTAIGFSEAVPVTLSSGSVPALRQHLESRAWESLYAEARKPG